MLAAVNSYESAGVALEFASDRLKADQEVVVQAVMHEPRVFYEAKGDFLSMERGRFGMQTVVANRKIALAMMLTGGNWFKSVAKELRDDFYVALYAVQSDHNALQYASERLQANDEIVQAAAKSKAVKEMQEQAEKQVRSK